MNRNVKIICYIAAAVASLIIGVAIGSVYIPPMDILRILEYKLFGTPLPEGFDQIFVGMVWNLRLPRVCMAFLAGAALSVCGTVMQSVLKNPLASSYGLGVSSGAGLGAALVIIFGLSGGLLGTFLLPIVGLSFGLATVFLAIAFASRMDHDMSNNTIILTGMVLSMFVNAIMTFLATSHGEYTQRIMLFQQGSFAMKEWSYVAVLLPVTIFGVLYFLYYARELDVMTFGEDQALALGVDLKKAKWTLIGMTAVLTGTAISFVGVIGFIDLIAPHIVRRSFGASHRYVVPLSALFGGTFMVLCDLVARTIASPSEIPVGAITACIGAPFFIYIYFKNRKR